MNLHSGRSAIIIGGGIGGLCAAIALNQVGIKARVFERASEMGEIGAGISLWANAIKALQKIGLDEAVLAVSALGTVGEFRTGQGQLLSEIASAELVKNYGAAHIAIHRADLQAVLLQALGEGVLELGAKCTGFEQTAQGVKACFADGREAQADILIGADGLRSAIRGQLWGETKPVYAGYTAWRGVTKFESALFPLGVGTEYWGQGQRFGLTHIGRGRVYWFAAKNAPQGGQDKPEGRQSELLEYYRDWAKPIEAVIAATDESAILRNDIYDRPPLKQWSQGRVTLLGDAAHPMTPNLGQGACQAIEDAVVLADCLRQAPEIAPALRLYDQRRSARTAKVTRQARQIGRIGQLQNPLICRARNFFLKKLPPQIQLKQMVWIVGYEA